MKFGKKQKLALLASLASLPAVSFAAVPETVTTAITTAAADVAIIGGAVLGVIIAIMAFRWMRKAF